MKLEQAEKALAEISETLDSPESLHLTVEEVGNMKGSLKDLFKRKDALVGGIEGLLSIVREAKRGAVPKKWRHYDIHEHYEGHYFIGMTKETYTTPSDTWTDDIDYDDYEYIIMIPHDHEKAIRIFEMITNRPYMPEGVWRD